MRDEMIYKNDVPVPMVVFVCQDCRHVVYGYSLTIDIDHCVECQSKNVERVESEFARMTAAEIDAAYRKANELRFSKSTGYHE